MTSPSPPSHYPLAIYSSFPPFPLFLLRFAPTHPLFPTLPSYPPPSPPLTSVLQSSYLSLSSHWPSHSISPPSPPLALTTLSLSGHLNVFPKGSHLFCYFVR